LQTQIGIGAAIRAHAADYKLIAVFPQCRGVAASSVGKRRSVRTVAPQQPNDSGGSRVKTKTLPEEKRQKPKAEFR
jgi:hypothetical protein